jgi:chromate reductase, NAD(P)H dehydrogenase (quinone)
MPVSLPKDLLAMPKTRTVAVLVGSLRKASYNRKMALALAKLAPETLKLEIVEIGDLPLYNEDVEAAGAPAAWTRFRNEVKGADALLFVTPEYNRSVPGCLKNAIDVGSRPYGSSVFAGKPGAIVSVSPGAIGGYGANHHLRQSMVFLDVPTMQQPEAYIGGAATLFDEQGGIANETTRGFATKFMQSFAAWVEANAKG